MACLLSSERGVIWEWPSWLGLSLFVVSIGGLLAVIPVYSSRSLSGLGLVGSFVGDCYDILILGEIVG